MADRDLSVEIEQGLDATNSEFALAMSSSDASLVVSATGELDLDARTSLREVLAPLAGSVVVDLSEVTFLDSSVIGALVGARNRLVASGGELRLRAPREFVRRTLTTVGLADWIVN